jgi:hypothetical protein
MSKPKLKRLVLEQDGVEYAIDLDGMDYSFSEERGVNAVWKPGHYAPTDMVSNGQRRFTLKAWSGCTTYASFDPGRR